VATVFETPNGAVAGNLAARFTLNREPTNLSIRYLPDGGAKGAWEVVYGQTDSGNDDGIFSDKFAGYASREGNTWQILPPNGVWPCRFRVVVDELPEPPVMPSGAVPWGVIYDLDLTAQPSADWSASGAHTLDGFTWYSKGSASFLGGPKNAIVNGSGLRPAATAYGATGNLNFQIPWFPFMQLPDFSPGSPYAATWKWSGTYPDTGHYLIGGLADMPDNGSIWLDGNRYNTASVRHGDDNAQLYSFFGGGFNPIGITPNGALANHSWLCAYLTRNIGATAHRVGALFGDVFTIGEGLSFASTAAQSNPGFYCSRNQDADIYLTRLTVLQPKV
jgi:hypothetical protein